MKRRIFDFGEYDPEADATDEEIEEWEQEDDEQYEQVKKDND